MKKVRIHLEGKVTEMTHEQLKENTDEISKRAIEGDKPSLAMLYVAQSATETIMKMKTITSKLIEAHAEMVNENNKIVRETIELLEKTDLHPADACAAATFEMYKHLESTSKVDPFEKVLVEVLVNELMPNE